MRTTTLRGAVARTDVVACIGMVMLAVGILAPAILRDKIASARLECRYRQFLEKSTWPTEPEPADETPLAADTRAEQAAFDEFLARINGEISPGSASDVWPEPVRVARYRSRCNHANHPAGRCVGWPVPATSALPRTFPQVRP